MLVLRSALFNVAFYLNITVLMLLGLPSILFGRHAAQFMARTWAASSLWLLERICGLRVEFRGLENVPKGALLIAPKHQSALETFAMTLPFPDFSYVLKRELMWLPIFGWYLAGAGQIAIDRGKGGSTLPSLTARARAAFAQGRQIFIFPEGTRRPIGAPPHYKYGVVHLYAESGVPCLPVAMNTGLFWPRRGMSRRPGVAVIEFLPVIAPGLDKAVFAEKLRDAVEQGSNRLIAEALARHPELTPDAAQAAEPKNA